MSQQLNKPVINLRRMNEPNIELMTRALINLYTKLETSVAGK